MSIDKRQALMDDLHKQANALTAEALRRIANTKPIGYLSDVGLFLCQLPATKTTRTMLGTTYVYRTKQAPSDAYVAETNRLGDAGQKMLAKCAEYLWGVIDADRTIGNRRYLDKGKKLEYAGLLSVGESAFLRQLELFWDRYPDADSGTVEKNGSISPWYNTTKKTG